MVNKCLFVENRKTVVIHVKLVENRKTVEIHVKLVENRKTVALMFELCVSIYIYFMKELS